jgi:chromate reductase
MLGNIGVTVVPNQVAISNGFTAFDEAGKLTDTRQTQMLAAAIDQMIATTNAMAASLPAT